MASCPVRDYISVKQVRALQSYPCAVRGQISVKTKTDDDSSSPMGTGESFDTNLKTAIETTGGKTIVDELFAAHLSIDLNTGIRRVALSEKTITDRKALRKRIVVTLQNLFKAIELAGVEHPDVDYKPMVNELNRLLVSYQSLIRSQQTRSRNWAQKTAVAVSSQTSATAV